VIADCRTSHTLQAARPSLSHEGADPGVDLQEVLDPAGRADPLENNPKINTAKLKAAKKRQ
jgi:hypothetical protein